jgi:hypothetical protein
MKKILGLIAITSALLTSCEINGENLLDIGLSEDEVIKGLKTALEVGSDSSTTTLHKTNGYLLDEAVKILLPPEADIITSNLTKIASYIPGGESIITDQLDNLVVSLNRAAEDAADDALPILTDAITNLSIQDGWDILNGIVPSGMKSSAETFDSLAATKYLIQETKLDLIEAFSAPINVSLDKKLVGNTSTNDIWQSVTNTYNTAVDLYNQVPLVTDLEKVNSNLGEYATGKALDGLFLKVGEQEKKIRRNPFEYVLDILHKVFGS